ncbi:2Fe-2S iron-sulfur cluster-binding protein [Phyllobacterium calauticae]|uniref:2Fe-2S iron-sulfur cluster-binding protein n=1 Tax=Phyllobacterium calauticae TaxID=2817027 RepID=UPI001CBD7317|nr:2Fe-2S iron-sulfur cluster binding domain-containing protein [Phyllobacterium calauticae]
MRSGKYSCTASETLLEVALNTGVWIDSSCQQGVYGSCKVKMTQGAVEMDDLGELSDDEKAEGYVLACCSRPRGAVTLAAWGLKVSMTVASLALPACRQCCMI